MKTTRFPHAAGATTLLLAATLLYAAHGTQAAKPPVMAAAAGSVSQGKALTNQYRCTGCHGPNLAGRQGFSPSIHLSGAMHDYTQAQFVTLLHAGITNDGSHVKKPMPVYAQMPAAQAKSIFAYLHTLK